MENTTDNPGFNFDSFDLFNYIVRHSRFLVIITLVAALAGGIGSFFLTPKFKSKVVLFPSTTTPVSQVLLNNSPNFNVGNLQGYGDEKDAEEMLQVLNSVQVKDRIIQKYNLTVHYAIDPSSKHLKSELYNSFSSNVSFRRNEFNAIEITVLDSDPGFASGMANDIAGMIDTLMNQIRKNRVKEAYLLLQRQYNNYLASVKQMEDSVSLLRKHGVYDVNSSIDRLTQGYADALVHNNQAAADKIDARLKGLGPYAAAYTSLSERLSESYKQVDNLKNRLMAMQVELDQFLPVKYVVDAAYPADRKAYPIRSLIIIVSALSAFILALFVMLLSDYWKKAKSQTA